MDGRPDPLDALAVICPTLTPLTYAAVLLLLLLPHPPPVTPGGHHRR